MKSKAPLVMMEQIIMVLVFALTAALCLQMFVLSETLSVRYEATDRAVLEAQKAAEHMKAGGLEKYLSEHYAEKKEADGYKVCFGEAWEAAITEENAEYYMEIHVEETELLWTAEIKVYDRKNSLLFELPVSGQKTVEG